MENDFSEVINKFSEILKDKNIDLNNLAGGNPPAENIDSSANKLAMSCTFHIPP